MKKNNKSKYGKKLTDLIKLNGMSQQSFYTTLGIRKPYFYDIVSGKVNPPPAETQLKIIKILKLKEKDKNSLLGIAAKERHELPADIILFLNNDFNVIDEIRNSERYKKYIKEGEI